MPGPSASLYRRSRSRFWLPTRIPLDLAGLFALAYDRGRYARSLDYAVNLDVPLSPADLAWAGELAKTARR